MPTPTQNFFSNELKLKKFDDDKKQIKSWSFSLLQVYEACPMRAKLAKIDRIPEPPPAEDSPLVRGSLLHEAAENYIYAKQENYPFNCYRQDLDRFREGYANGTVEVEGEWGYDRDWNVTDWKSAWLRMKLDVLEWQSDTHVLITDWKSGKKDGNQIKHTQQGQLYAVGVFMRYPQVQSADIQFAYIDKPETKPLQLAMNRAEAARPMKKFTDRGEALTSATTFPAKPNQRNCKFCPYGVQNGNAQCPFAV